MPAARIDSIAGEKRIGNALGHPGTVDQIGRYHIWRPLDDEQGPAFNGRRIASVAENSYAVADAVAHVDKSVSLIVSFVLFPVIASSPRIEILRGVKKTQCGTMGVCTTMHKVCSNGLAATASFRLAGPSTPESLSVGFLAIIEDSRMNKSFPFAISVVVAVLVSISAGAESTWQNVDGTKIPVPPPEHPRLYLQAEHAAQLPARLQDPVLQPVVKRLEAMARKSPQGRIEWEALQYLVQAGSEPRAARRSSARWRC